MHARALAILALPLALVVGCSPSDSGDDMASSAAAAAAAFVPPTPTPPPAEEGALAALNASPRHGEWVDVPMAGGPAIRTWAVYPERPDNAPVVIVTMEIYGLTDWIRSVADQFAAEGFIALAPDLLSGMGPNGGTLDVMADRDAAVAAVRSLAPDETMRRLDAVYAYAQTIPAATDRIGIVGYCWGGGTSFAYAVHQPSLGASVVYYGTSPAEGYDRINAPVLGLYGGADQRVNATIPTAEQAMGSLGKSYTPVIFDGAGHGFLRAQDGQEGANMLATQQAWPRTVEFFRQHLEG